MQLIFCLIARRYQKIGGTNPYPCECMQKYNTPEEDPENAERRNAPPPVPPQGIIYVVQNQQYAIPPSNINYPNYPPSQNVYNPNNPYQMGPNQGTQYNPNPNTQLPV